MYPGNVELRFRGDVHNDSQSCLPQYACVDLGIHLDCRAQKIPLQHLPYLWCLTWLNSHTKGPLVVGIAKVPYSV